MMISLYIEKESIIHRTPFLIKVVCVSLVVSTLYMYHPPWFLILCCMACIICYLIAGISLLELLRVIKFFLPILVISTLLNILINPRSLHVVLQIPRLITAIGFTHLLSLSTPAAKIIRECKIIFAPLRIFGVPSTLFPLLITVVLRTIPILIQDFTTLQKSFALRGGRKHQQYRLIIPLIIVSLSQCDMYSYALSLRGLRIIL